MARHVGGGGARTRCAQCWRVRGKGRGHALTARQTYAHVQYRNARVTVRAGGGRCVRYHARTTRAWRPALSTYLERAYQVHHAVVRQAGVYVQLPHHLVAQEVGLPFEPVHLERHRLARVQALSLQGGYVDGP